MRKAENAVECRRFVEIPLVAFPPRGLASCWQLDRLSCRISLMRFWPNYLFIDFAEAFERHPELVLGIYCHFWLAAQAIADAAIELGIDADEIDDYLADFE